MYIVFKCSLKNQNVKSNIGKKIVIVKKYNYEYFTRVLLVLFYSKLVIGHKDM